MEKSESKLNDAQRPRTQMTRNNGKLSSEIKIFNPASKAATLSKHWVLVPKWAVIAGVCVAGFITVTLVTASVISGTSQRPGLYGEKCVGRSCLSSTGLKCINQTCGCLSNQYYATKCLDKRNYKQTCSSSVPCKENTDLACLSGICQCNSTAYWNNSACVHKSTYKGSCTNDSHCLTSQQLLCDTKTKLCYCQSNRYWDGSECMKKRTMNETCTQSSECISTQNLVCLNGLCTCSSMVTQYWDINYQMCFNRLSENKSCSSTDQCFTPMLCSSGLCKCSGSFKYHNQTSYTCENQKNYTQSCSVNYNCRVDKGLECISNGTCQCVAATPDWITSLSKCIKKQSYAGSCTSNVECDSTLGLTCNTAGSSGSCDCPYSTSNQCDCTRVNNNENYWNGSTCAPAGSFGQTCVANANYSCQSITQKTMCNSTGYCSCGTNGGLKSSTQECVSCGIGWQYVNEMCYRIETSAGDSDNDGDGGPIDTACNVNVPSGGSSSLQLAFLNSQAALDYFKSISVAGQQYWVNIHKTSCNSGSNTCYQSCSSGCGSGSSNWWTVYNSGYSSGTDEFCNSPNGNDCGYYDFDGDCYGDYSCSTNLPYYCEHKAV